MEEHRIGTDASMAQHINNICERNFVQVKETPQIGSNSRVIGVNRRLVPTLVGVSLIHGYYKIEGTLVSPDFRRAIEEAVDRIARVTFVPLF